MGLARNIDDMIEPMRTMGEHYIAPFWDLAARLYVANALFKSGQVRYFDWQSGHFANQVAQFQHDPHAHGLPPEMLAYAALISEVAFPIMLAAGLFGRLAALGLLVITLIIEWVMENYAWGLKDPIIWTFLTTAILLRGSGALSLDYLLLKYIRR